MHGLYVKVRVRVRIFSTVFWLLQSLYEDIILLTDCKIVGYTIMLLLKNINFNTFGIISGCG